MVSGAYLHEPPASIGRYDVIEELGRGGMGVVYHAYDATLDRSIALKILPPELAARPGFVQRLRREAISTARMRHPHIALLYEFGQADGETFLTMEYVAGPSLRQLLESGPLPPERAIALAEQIAAALDYAHSLGIVHCDVKPSNIIVGPNDQAVLIDFGLAQIAEDPAITGDSALLGTPHYMAPEQARDNGAQPASDQYALAAVVYEMLTGVPPFSGKSAAGVLHAHIYELPPAVSERRPSLPEAINAALLRGLAKQPAERYPSAAAFAAALRAAFVAQRPSGVPRRTQWIAGAAVAVIMLAALGTLLFQNMRARETAAASAPIHVSVPVPSQVAWWYDTGFADGSTPTVAAQTLVFGTLDGSIVALDAQDGGVRWRKDSDARLFGTPATGAGPIFVGDSDGLVLCLDPQTGATMWQQRVNGAVQHPPLRSNERLMVVTATGYLYMLQSATGRVIWSRPVAEGLSAPVVGGGSVFVSRGSSLLALDWNTGAPRWQWNAPSPITTVPLIARDLVLVGTERGTLHGIAVDGGQQRLEYQARGPITAAPVVDADAIYLGDRSGTLTAIDPAAQRPIWHFDAQTAIMAAPLLVDGKLFVGTSGGKLYTLDARSGRELGMMQLEGSITSAPARHADLIYVSAKRLYALGP